MRAELSPSLRWKVICAYDGTSFAGWQSQVGGRSIQDVIEARLSEVAGGLVRIHGSGRTDAGVHALAQVFHFDLPWKHAPERLRAALRVNLPAGLQLKSVRPVPATFHARFSATGKRYSYRIYLGDADPFLRPFVWSIERPTAPRIDAMIAAAERLRGRHDFAAFSANNGAANQDTVRTLRRLEIRKKGRHLTIIAEADGFLYKMVRSLVGALVSVGWGKLTAAQLSQFLASGVRTAAVETAPPQGLFLEKVFYQGVATGTAPVQDE
ncbi:MAG TPA: tRNA pseudouridine(38-40) synthase TruA [Opitutaceae bacterium]|nr:tRNA pseudouridine(38-40) synthase TruA [Opitutaceae bacterium]